MTLTRRGALLGLAALPAGCATPGSSRALPATAPTALGVTPPARFAEAAQAAANLLAAHRIAIGAPGLSAAVAVGGEIVWAQAFGWADLEGGRPATPATKFRIGSTSKALTVTVTGRLLDQGVVDFDEPISTYLADLPAPWRPMTLRQLHSHTSGLPGYENNRDYLGLLNSILRHKHYDDVAGSIDQFDGAPLLYPPGQGFYYTSYDVVLASVVLQAAARTPYLDLLSRQVLDPVGMTSSGGDHADRAIPDRAVFYDRTRTGVRRSRFVDLSGRYAAGGLLSTSSDLTRLGSAYLHGDLLRRETVATLWTPQRLPDGQVNEQSYALGWRSKRAPSKVLGGDVWKVHHGGISTGAMSWLLVYPDLDIVLAFNINTEAETFGAFSAPDDAVAKLFRDAVA